MPRISVLVTLLVMVACPAVAQTSLRSGQTVQGEMTTSDPTRGDGRHHDCFSALTRIGQTQQINPTSGRFDSYHQAGSVTCQSNSNNAISDKSGRAFNARLQGQGNGFVRIPQANSLSEGMTGRYIRTVAAAGQERANPLSAEAAGGPLYEVGGAEGQVIFMVSGPMPRARPTAPVEVWEWQFWPGDTAAFRARINCQTETRQNLRLERYVNGTLNGRRELSDTAITPQAGTTGASTVRMVCEPGFADQRRSHANYQAARSHMDRYFAARR